MSSLPKIDDSVGDAISDWTIKANPTSRIVNTLEKFYDSIFDFVEPHKKNKLYYRGLSISDDGFRKFTVRGQLDLKSKLAESWSCHLHIARRFGDFTMEREISNRDVIIDFYKVMRLYEKPYKKKDMEYFSKSGFEAMRKLNVFKECELLTNTICTSCSIHDMVEIGVEYNESISDSLLDLYYLLKKGDNRDDSSLERLLEKLEKHQGFKKYDFISLERGSTYDRWEAIF